MDVCTIGSAPPPPLLHGQMENFLNEARTKASRWKYQPHHLSTFMDHLAPALGNPQNPTLKRPRAQGWKIWGGGRSGPQLQINAILGYGACWHCVCTAQPVLNAVYEFPDVFWDALHFVV